MMKTHVLKILIMFDINNILEFFNKFRWTPNCKY